jgi:trehalose 6-phosphate phosphatase
MLAEDEVSAAIYAGDDRSDIGAFRRLRELREQGRLKTAVCVGVSSAEQPTELDEYADLTVDGPPGWLAVLRALAG